MPYNKILFFNSRYLVLKINKRNQGYAKGNNQYTLLYMLVIT